MTRSVLIVGAGNFGAATALALARQGDTEVVLVDTTEYPNPRAASHDVNKIVRDDYPDALYMQMLIKAMPQWRSNDLYKSYYHEVGMLRADKTDFGINSLASYKRAGVKNESCFLPVEEVRQRWNGAFASANFGDLTHVLFNPTVGFAEADKALKAVIKEAISAGVKYVIGEMTKLTFTSDGQCAGIALKSGEVLEADQILLCTGAHTPALLAQSAPKNKDLHCGDRVVATGAVSFKAKLTGSRKKKFEPIPVLKNCLDEVKGEGMSILKDGTIKFNCDMCFTNMQTFEATGDKMSVIPSGFMFNVWTNQNYIKYFEARARRTMDGLYGDEVADIKIESYRMCWDASTPTHDFLITPHPHCNRLYIATGGSFHSWKFLPVIGEYVKDMLEGTLAEAYAQRWHWDQPATGKSANPTYKIVGDLQDIMSGKLDPKPAPMISIKPNTPAAPMVDVLADGVTAH
jgi:sarcosine oxidase/L-pipecolate oxidase